MRRLRVCLWAGFLAFAGCVGHHTNSRTAQLLDDKVVARRVEAALQAASPKTFSHVRLKVQDAVVTLRGSVPNAQAKAEASQIAKDVERVQAVINQLQIRDR